MDDQNKKQIVIIVVIIIVLVLMLLGVLVVAVVSNKSSGGSLSNNTTMAVDSTKTTQSAVMSTTTSSQNNLSNDENNTGNDLLFQGIDSYLLNLKNEGRIGEYVIGELVRISAQDSQNFSCPNVTYDSTKIYVSTNIDYVKIPDSQPLLDIEEVVEGRVSVGMFFALSIVGNTYVVEEMFPC